MRLTFYILCGHIWIHRACKELKSVFENYSDKVYSETFSTIFTSKQNMTLSMGWVMEGKIWTSIYVFPILAAGVCVYVWCGVDILLYIVYVECCIIRLIECPLSLSKCWTWEDDGSQVDVGVIVGSLTPPLWVRNYCGKKSCGDGGNYWGNDAYIGLTLPVIIIIISPFLSWDSCPLLPRARGHRGYGEDGWKEG